MLRPNQQDDVQQRDTDELEGATGLRKDPPTDSRSSEADAGLDDKPWFEPDVDLDSDLDEADAPREITMTDLEAQMPGSSFITSAELSDLNTPGDVDIEDLDYDDLDDTDLPPDARLDPLEP